jgi:hypothetical protein
MTTATEELDVVFADAAAVVPESGVSVGPQTSLRGGASSGGGGTANSNDFEDDCASRRLNRPTNTKKMMASTRTAEWFSKEGR